MTKYDARGTTLELDDGGGNVKVAQVINFSGPGFSSDTEDATDHDSPGGFEEVLVTILRTGELTVEIHYDPADSSHDASTGLLAHWEGRTQLTATFTFPDAASTTWTFDCYVTGFEPAAPHDGKLTASVTLKIDGQPSLT